MIRHFLEDRQVTGNLNLEMGREIEIDTISLRYQDHRTLCVPQVETKISVKAMLDHQWTAQI